MGRLGTLIWGEYLFMAFIGADYIRCLWIYKITRFSYCFCKVLVMVVVEGDDVNFWKFAGGGLPRSNKYEQGSLGGQNLGHFVKTECPSYKKKVLKEIVLFFFEKPVELDYTRQFHQLESFVLDISDTKPFKSKKVILLIKVWGH